MLPGVTKCNGGRKNNLKGVRLALGFWKSEENILHSSVFLSFYDVTEDFILEAVLIIFKFIGLKQGLGKASPSHLFWVDVELAHFLL